MMMTHRIVLKTHPLLATHVRSVHSILFRSGLQRRSAPKGAASEENAKPALCEGGSFLLFVIDRFGGDCKALVLVHNEVWPSAGSSQGFWFSLSSGSSGSLFNPSATDPFRDGKGSLSSRRPRRSLSVSR